MKQIKRLSFLLTKNMMEKSTKVDLKQKLSPTQYSVTQQNSTEPPFKNQYYNCKKNGIYKCIVCNVELFSSETKFDSGSGWPAFWDEMKTANIIKNVDKTHGMVRTQVRCSKCDSHLGHLFKDGPKPTGIRYCINSASINLEQK